MRWRVGARFPRAGCSPREMVGARVAGAGARGDPAKSACAIPPWGGCRRTCPRRRRAKDERARERNKSGEARGKPAPLPGKIEENPLTWGSSPGGAGRTARILRAICRVRHGGALSARGREERKGGACIPGRRWSTLFFGVVFPLQRRARRSCEGRGVGRRGAGERGAGGRGGAPLAMGGAVWYTFVVKFSCARGGRARGRRHRAGGMRWRAAVER